MLQSFTGTFDAGGIRSFQLEQNHVPDPEVPRAAVRFWAVLDSCDAPLIQRAISAGDRTRALRLISDHSLSMGTILPD